MFGVRSGRVDDEVGFAGGSSSVVFNVGCGLAREERIRFVRRVVIELVFWCRLRRRRVRTTGNKGWAQWCLQCLQRLWRAVDGVRKVKLGFWMLVASLSRLLAFDHGIIKCAPLFEMRGRRRILCVPYVVPVPRQCPVSKFKTKNRKIWLGLDAEDEGSIFLCLLGFFDGWVLPLLIVTAAAARAESIGGAFFVVRKAEARTHGRRRRLRATTLLYAQNQVYRGKKPSATSGRDARTAKLLAISRARP